MRILTFPPLCATSSMPPGMTADEALGEIRDHFGLFALLTAEQVVNAVKQLAINDDHLKVTIDRLEQELVEARGRIDELKIVATRSRFETVRDQTPRPTAT